MIKVIYDRKRYRVTVEGHARSGEAGHDLVCAAVSSLTYTLAANMLSLKDMGRADKATVTLDPGEALIHIKPQNKFRAIVSIILDSFCVGYELLARDYPENISYEIV